MTAEEVVDLAKRRDEKTGFNHCQNCPSSYFKVHDVVLTSDGGVSGYAGIPCCSRCGTLRTDGVPEGVAMPCGGCSEPVVLPRNATHRCGALPCGCSTRQLVDMNGCKQGHGEEVDW